MIADRQIVFVGAASDRIFHHNAILADMYRLAY
jgi:hypothetical protein